MGIDITAGSKSSGMSYSGWSEFRNNIIFITIMYLNKTFEKSKNDVPDVCEPYKEVAKELCNEMTTNTLQKDVLFAFLDIISKSNIDRLNALIEYGVGGLYSLCAKNDCEGYYSSGNSLDICNLFDIIKEDVKMSDENLYHVIYDNSEWSDSIYSVFEESWKKNIPLCIH